MWRAARKSRPCTVAPLTRMSPGGGHQAQDHLEQRALARAVVADEAEDLAALHAQVDAVHGVQGTVVLVHASHLNGGGCARVSGGGLRVTLKIPLGLIRLHAGLGPTTVGTRSTGTAGPPGAVPAPGLASSSLMVGWRQVRRSTMSLAS